MKSYLPRGWNLAMGEFIIVRCISNDFVCIPLHRVHLVSDLVSKLIVVAVVSQTAYESRMHVVRERAIWWEGNYASKGSARTGHFDRNVDQ